MGIGGWQRETAPVASHSLRDNDPPPLMSAVDSNRARFYSIDTDPHQMATGISIFETPKGREYAVPWGDLSNPERSGMLKMTDFLFNHYFLPIAFGWDGVYFERTYKQSKAYSMTRRIGGPAITNIVRKEYKIRVTPTWRGGAYDTGTQLYAIDGKDLWNFEITGRVTEFRIWARERGRLGQLKRPFEFKTATGNATGSLIVAAGN